MISKLKTRCRKDPTLHHRSLMVKGRILARSLQPGRTNTLRNITGEFTPEVGMQADTCLVSATSRTFELAIALSPGYLHRQRHNENRRGRLAERAALVTQQIGAISRRVVPVHVFGILSRICAGLILFVVLFFGPLASDAQAHGIHAGLSVQTAANWEESAGSESEAKAEAQRTMETDCGVYCCSATSCAAAVLTASHPGIAAFAADNRFALLDNALAKPSAQSSLKRPPKA